MKQLGAHVVCAHIADDDDWSDGTKCRGNGDNWRIELRDPKGGDPAEWPAALHVREFPNVAVAV